MSYSVLYNKDCYPLPTSELAGPLREFLGGLAYDWIARLNRNFGWLARGLGKDVAETLQSHLERHGIPTRVKDDATMSRFETFSVSRASLDATRLDVQLDLTGPTRSISWQNVAMLSLGTVPAGRLTTGVKKHSLLEAPKGAVLARGSVTRGEGALVMTAKILEEKDALLHVYVRSPNIVVAIRPREFFYDYLGERRCQVSGENFALLVDDFRRFATRAYWPCLTRDYAANGRDQHAFGNATEFARYNTWLYETFADV